VANRDAADRPRVARREVVDEVAIPMDVMNAMDAKH
jgi:hypothetical protein